MLRTAFGYRRFFFLFISLTFVIFLFSPELQKKPVRLIGKPLGNVVYLFYAGLYGVRSGVESVWSGYVNLVGVREENIRLHRELAELMGENNRLREKGEMALRLQTLLDYTEQSPHQFIAAEVVGRKFSHWYNTMMINRGERDGVSVDMGVVKPNGIVGKVVKTGSNFAQVLLITDHNSAVAGINQRTRDAGIVEGMEGGRVRMKYLLQFVDIQPNDVILTSGLEGTFPKGLKIGLVDHVEKREHDLFLHVEVVPELDLSKLEEVFVITHLGRES